MFIEREMMGCDDVALSDKNKITLHFTYDKNLTLKELSDLLDLSNKAINDFNRANGVSNQAVSKQYAAEVGAVKEGSVIVEILQNFVAPLSVAVLGTLLSERLQKLGQKKTAKEEKKSVESVDDGKTIFAQSKYPIVISANDVAGNVTYNIHIHNSQSE